jgi:hypothetical protein
VHETNSGDENDWQAACHTSFGTWPPDEPDWFAEGHRAETTASSSCGKHQCGKKLNEFMRPLNNFGFSAYNTRAFVARALTRKEEEAAGTAEPTKKEEVVR